MDVQSLIVVLLLILTGIVSITFYKVRKIHLATFQLQDKVADIAYESKHLYAQLQAYLDLVRLVKLEGSLPTLRGWAASPDFLLEVAKAALAIKPKVVMECSSGASTIVLARCLEMVGAGHVYSLENDSRFAEKTRKDLERLGLAGWATVVDAPLVDLAELPDHRWYDLSRLGTLEGAVEMLVVDGPPTFTCRLARYPAVPLLKHLFAKQCQVFVDDAARPDEQEMVKRWMDEVPGLLKHDLGCEKGCVQLVKS